MIFGIFRPYAGYRGPTKVERFPNQEAAARQLKMRALQHEGRFFDPAQKKYLAPNERPQYICTKSTGTASMTMFYMEPEPDHRPDEIWTLNLRGTVVRNKWTPEPEPMAVCPACFQMPAANGKCGCS